MVQDFPYLIPKLNLDILQKISLAHQVALGHLADDTDFGVDAAVILLYGVIVRQEHEGLMDDVMVRFLGKPLDIESDWLEELREEFLALWQFGDEEEESGCDF